MLALGCEVEVAVVGSPSRLLRAAGGAWQRERVRPSRAFFFFFLQLSSGPVWIFYEKQSEARARAWAWASGPIDGEEPSPAAAKGTGRCGRQLCGAASTLDQWGVLFFCLKGCRVTFILFFFSFLALGDCFRLRATTAPTHHIQPEWNAVMKQWGQNKKCPNWRLTHIFYTTNLVQLHVF